MTVHWEDGIVVLEGEFDLANQQLIRTAITTATADRVGQLVIDMAAVTFADATSVRCLLEPIDTGLQIVVRNPSRTVRRLLEVTGADKVLIIDT